MTGPTFIKCGRCRRILGELLPNGKVLFDNRIMRAVGVVDSVECSRCHTLWRPGMDQAS